MFKAISNFYTLRTSEHVAYLRHIVKSLSNNKALANVYPPASDLEEIASLMHENESEIKTLKEKLAMRYSALQANRRSAIAALNTMSESVNYLADASKEVLDSSGFFLREVKYTPPRIAKRLSKVLNLEVMRTDENGQVQLRWTKVSGAKTYVIEFTKNPSDDESWKPCDYTEKPEYTGYIALPRGENGEYVSHKLHFRVAAIGAQGAGIYSAVVSKLLV